MRRIQTGRTVLAVDFSPDGRYLASGGWNHVSLWDLGTGDCVDFNQDRCSYVFSLAFCDDGSHLAWLCHGIGVELRMGEVDFARQTNEIRLGGAGRSFSTTISHCELAVAPNGDLWCAQDGAISQWSVPDLEKRSPDVFREAPAVAVWQSPLGRMPVIETGPEKRPTTMAWVEAGTLIGKANGSGFEVWRVGDQQPILNHKDPRVRAVGFSPDGRFIYGTGEKYISVWDTGSRSRRERFDWDISTPECIAISPDGITAAASGFSGEIVIWDLDG